MPQVSKLFKKMGNIQHMLNLRKDKGFAWCVLVMSIFSHLVHRGFLFSVLGTATIAHKSLHGLDIQQSALIGTVQVAVFFFLGPLASIMVKKLSCRVTELVGGASILIGLGLSSLTTRVWHSYLLYSVLPAWGVTCCTIATSSILPLHFQKYKYLAYAMSMLGYFVGMAMWPTVSQKLFDVYGYHKAMGIMASFHVVHIIAGILFFEPSSNGPPDKENTNTKNDVIEDPQMENQVQAENERTQESTDKKEAARDGIPPMGLLMSFKLLFRSGKVWSIICNCILCSFNINSYFILVNDYMVKRLSISTDDAALGLTISGIGNFVGCCIIIAISRRKLDRVVLHAGCALVFGTCTMVMSASVNKVMFYALAAVWGVAQGAFLSNVMAVINELSSDDEIPLMLGIILFAQGIGALGAAPLCTHTAKALGSIFGLILSGCFGVLGCLSYLPLIVYNYRCKPPVNDQAPSLEGAAMSNDAFTSSNTEINIIHHGPSDTQGKND